MRPYLKPLAVLAAILAFALWNGATMTSHTDRWRAQLEQADALAQAEEWSQAVDVLTDSYADWCSRQTYLHIVTEHDAVDGRSHVPPCHGLRRHPGDDGIPGGAG